MRHCTDKISIPTWTYFNIDIAIERIRLTLFQSLHGLILTFRARMKLIEYFQFQSLHGLILTLRTLPISVVPLLISIPTWTYFNLIYQKINRVCFHYFNPYMDLF